MNKNDILELAQRGIIRVVFTKTDGSERIMKCTLHPDLLPVDDRYDQSIVEKTRKENPNILAVWDVEKHEFRSFRINSIVSIDYLQDVKSSS